MTEVAATEPVLDSDTSLKSNNPYRERAANHLQDDGKQVAGPAANWFDDGKQVVSNDDGGKQVVSSDASEKQVVSNNDSEKQVVSSDASEKQVVSSREDDAALNAPMVVSEEESATSSLPPAREADKEVTSSWQSKSQGDGAPIPMQFHESQSQGSQGQLLNDIKGPPPAYDSVEKRQSRSSDDDMVTPSTSIEPDSPAASPKAEDRSFVGQLMTWIPRQPKTPTSQMPKLLQPVVIPQLDVPPRGESVPFVRCYSDILATHGISIREFTSFLDGLAVAQSPNSALQGLKMFGAGVGHIPLPIIPLAGKGIAALASSGSGHSGSRARLYIERAKHEYFEPRGLRLSILKDPDLSARLQMPTHASRLAPLTKNTLNENISKRRMEAIAPYVAPLRYDVPEQDKQTQGVHKLARKHLDMLFRSEGKRIIRMREQQWRDIQYSMGAETGPWEERYVSKLAEIRRNQLEFTRIQSEANQIDAKAPEIKEITHSLQENQRELQVLMTERQMSMQSLGSRGRGVEAEMEEVDLSRRLKWIVIENL